MDKHILLHIYGQSSWHSPALIVGNRCALSAIRDAISTALESGKAECYAMAWDGEDYSVEITLDDNRWEHPSWETKPTPYIEPYARGEPDLHSEISLWKIALNKANAGLVKRGIKPVPEPDMPKER